MFELVRVIVFGGSKFDYVPHQNQQIQKLMFSGVEKIKIFENCRLHKTKIDWMDTL
jgi:hypothetical protein